MLNIIARLLVVAAVAAPAHARTIEGFDFHESIQLGGSTLQLNGVGLRQVAWLKGYAAALYLDRKASTPQEVLEAPAPKRLQIRMLVEADTEEFVKSFNRGVARNTPPERMPALAAGMAEFDRLLRAIGKVKKNDVVDIDLLPGRGLVLALNGTARGKPIPGDELYAALLRVFLGAKPSDKVLKNALLGVAP